MRLRHLIIVASIAATFMVGITLHTAHATAIVTASPSSFTIAEGTSQIVSFTLDEPIIAPSETGYLDIYLSLSDPARQELSSLIVHFDETEWSQTKTVTFTATDDSAYFTSGAMTIGMNVVSNSEYYNGYTSSINLNVTDNDLSNVPPQDQDQSSGSSTQTPAATPSAPKDTSTDKKDETKLDDTTNTDKQTSLNTSGPTILQTTGATDATQGDAKTSRQPLLLAIGAGTAILGSGIVTLQRLGKGPFRRARKQRYRIRKRKRKINLR